MAHIAINALSLRKGGGLQVLAGLLARFSEENRYTVLCSDADSRTRFEAISGARPHVTYTDPVGSGSGSAIFCWGIRKQARWLAENEADCIFGVNHHYPAGAVPQVIYHLNVLRFERERKPFWAGGEVADRLRDWRARVALEKSQANLFESKMLYGIAEKTQPEIRAPQVVYIGLDDRSSSSQAGTDESRNPLILAVTSEAPHKDNATLIRMVAELNQMHPDTDWRLKIAGGDREGFADLKALAINLGVAKRIEYLGFVTHDALQKLGKQAHCLVTTSLVESFCMVALEAMSWGCPVVVSDISSMPESVGEAGLLAKPSDPADFAVQVSKLWENRTLRETMVARGRERAALLTWTSAAQSVEAVFREVIAQAETGVPAV